MSYPLTCITCRNQCFYIVYLRYTRSRVMECLAIWNRWQLNNYMLLTVTFQHYIKDILPLEIYQRHLYSQSDLAFEPNAPHVPNAKNLKDFGNCHHQIPDNKGIDAISYIEIIDYQIHIIFAYVLRYIKGLKKFKHILCY